MQQYLARFRKQPREVLTYTVDYNPWLAADELIVSANLDVAPVSDPPLEVSNLYTQEGLVVFTVSGGLSGVEYQGTVITSTDKNQTVERELFWTVEEL